LEFTIYHESREEVLIIFINLKPSIWFEFIVENALGYDGFVLLFLSIRGRAREFISYKWRFGT